MKKMPIILLSLITVLVILMVVSVVNSGTYATFADAKLSPEKNMTIIGTLNKDKPIIYDPEVDANRTTFHLFDKDGKENVIVYHDVRPRDIERSEEITIEGKMVDGEFHAVHLLMKCPSKYTPNEINLKEVEGATY